MGNQMSFILPNLYLGGLGNAYDQELLKKHSITHIVSAYEDARPLNDHCKFLCINASDTVTEDLSQHFSRVNDFVHDARKKGAVLIHCAVGVSRSATLTIAYVMTVTGLPFEQVFKILQSRRPIVNPNEGFRRQLEIFGEPENLSREITRFRKKFDKKQDRFNDLDECKRILWQLEDGA